MLKAISGRFYGQGWFIGVVVGWIFMVFVLQIGSRPFLGVEKKTKVGINTSK